METKVFTKDQILEFLEIHMGQKEPEALKETLDAYGEKEDCYYMGLFEGILNGILLAGGQLSDEFPQDSDEVKEISTTND